MTASFTSRRVSPRASAYALLLIALIAAPWVGLYPVLGTKILCYALFACAFHLLLGYTGLASLGHAAFLGVGGYLAGYGVKAWALPPELALLAGLAAGALLGLVIGFISIRRSGIYFTMITLALAQMVYFLCVQIPQTGGEDGLQGIDRGLLFGVLDLRDDTAMYYTVLVIAVACFLLITRVVYSPFGQALQAIKDNEPRAISLGYHPPHYKLIVFILSAALTGLAGALKAISLGFVTLSDVHWMTSGHALLMTLVGGMGILSGPVVGALALVVLENKMGELGTLIAGATGIAWFTTLGESVMMVMGIVFVICVLAFRHGIMGEVVALQQRRRGTLASSSTTSTSREPQR
ncbi:branched-chain amino acid ABC transporter permease [Alcanivorax marinus]|uniref:Branched-chain amino acid ABC transporter permease n=1 Tax=Alloalcanivorax marinus TaxID=1177169 RepID=A0A9Q3YN44_9GAMM|nr:branched-chain amino acid ABC transporter permease [Alloalcanivorax marinus]MCC4309494.1 branched-chain amino acid ABC transporter permease [Alloalcanivorax marinus]